MKGIVLRDFEVRRLASSGSVLIWRRVKCGANSIHLGRLLGTWSLSVPPFQWDGNKDDLYNWCGGKRPKTGDWIEIFQTDVDDHASAPVKCPFGVTGETRFVKETGYWIRDGGDGNPCVAYRAENVMKPHGCSWRPSTTMPSWASRFRVTLSVSCRQIQSVTDFEAYYGGAPSESGRITGPYCMSYVQGFKSLIESRHPGSWERNEWQWAINLEVKK